MQDNTKDSPVPTPPAASAAMGKQSAADTRSATTASAGQAAPTSRPAGRKPPIHPLWLAAGVAALFGLVFGVGAISASPGTSTSSAPSGTTIEATTISVIRTVSPSVVQIQGRGNGPGGSVGSGEILTTSGYIVTNDHVVHGFSSYAVLLADGRQVSAQLVGEAPTEDLAVLKISASNLKPITVGDSSQVQVGEYDVALGSPLGLEQSATSGIISALNRTVNEVVDGQRIAITGLIQTSAPINPGNSGGALVNLNGQLIGIPTLAAVNSESQGSQTSIGFAINSNRVQYVAEQLIQNGKVTSTGQGFLGIEAQDVTPQIAQADGLSVNSGVLVRSFVNDAAGVSPAQKAGLQAGDVITKVDGTTVTDNNDLAGALQNKAPGSKVSLTVVRGTSTQTISVTLGERPAAQG